MVACDLSFAGTSCLPSEANPILIVDPDAVLPVSAAAQAFEAIPRRNSKLAEVFHSIDLIELPPGNSPQIPGISSSGSGGLGTSKMSSVPRPLNERITGSITTAPVIILTLRLNSHPLRMSGGRTEQGYQTERRVHQKRLWASLIVG